MTTTCLDLDSLDATTVERFWSKVDTSGGPAACWPWTLPLDRDGYGHARFSGRRTYIADGVAYALAVGMVPEGLQVVHADGHLPSCCNPAHLELAPLEPLRARARAEIAGLQARLDAVEASQLGALAAAS